MTPDEMRDRIVAFVRRTAKGYELDASAAETDAQYRQNALTAILLRDLAATIQQFTAKDDDQ
jgi:hypothetical protein